MFTKLQGHILDLQIPFFLADSRAAPCAEAPTGVPAEGPPQGCPQKGCHKGALFLYTVSCPFSSRQCADAAYSCDLVAYRSQHSHMTCKPPAYGW